MFDIGIATFGFLAGMMFMGVSLIVFIRCARAYDTPSPEKETQTDISLIA
jgi:hypothetical protein